MGILKKVQSPEKGLEILVRSEGLRVALFSLGGGSMVEQACVHLELEVPTGRQRLLEAGMSPCVRHSARVCTSPPDSCNNPKRERWWSLFHRWELGAQRGYVVEAENTVLL